MSEHTPITGELREAVEWEPTFCGPDRAMVPQPEFDSLCDAIDAVHAGLERENAELRERLAALDNRSESMHDGGRITDELRAWWVRKFPVMDKELHKDFTAIADRIDAEHEQQMAERRRSCVFYDAERNYCKVHDEGDMAELGYVRLPVDADGIPVHIDDVMEWPDGRTFEVVGIGDGTLFYVESDDADHAEWTGASTKRHHHAPTVEDVLQKLLEQAVGYSDAHTTVALNTIAEYAKRLRLAGDAE